MADATDITVRAGLMPDAVRKTLEGKISVYTPADATEGWYYKRTNILVTTNGTDIITTGGAFLNKATAGSDSGATRSTIAATDVVKFLFIEHTGFEDNGSTPTSDSIYIVFDGGNVAHTTRDAIEIKTGHVWFANFAAVQVQEIHAIAARPAGGGTTSNKILCDIYAIIDDV